MDDALDDYDFTPSTTSNLSSLFGSPMQGTDSTSLIYTAPKQPRSTTTESSQEPSAAKSESAVICARVVNVWKLIDNKYDDIGKMGLAVIGIVSQNFFEVILYKEKNNITARAKIGDSLNWTLNKDSFVSFYDNIRQYWLVKFSSNEDCNAVTSQIEKCGGNTNNSIAAKEQPVSKPEELASDVTQNQDKSLKDNLITRIAKVGQSILPVQTHADPSTDISDSEDDSYRLSRPRVSPKPDRHAKNQSSVVPFQTNASFVQTTSPPTTFPTNFIQSHQQIQNIPNTFLMGQTMTCDPLSLMYSESRTHNAEIKLNLAQISDKLNQVLLSVNPSKSQDNDDSFCKSKVKVLELKIENLYSDMKRYEQKNANLLKKLDDKDKALQSCEDRYNVLVLSKENDKSTEIDSLKKQVTDLQENGATLLKTIDVQKDEIENIKTELEQINTKTTREHEIEIEELTNKISSLQLKLQNIENNDDINNFTGVLKQTMNEMYGNIMTNFNDGENYSSSQINSIVAKNIKSTTVTVIESYEQILKNRLNDDQ